MLKCNDFIGSFGRCEEFIYTKLIAERTALISYEYLFYNVLKRQTINITAGEEIILPNEFPIGLTELEIEEKKIIFEIKTQCLS